MSTQSDLNSVNPIEAALQAIMRRLDNLDEKLQPLQPLQEKVAMLEESRNTSREIATASANCPPGRTFFRPGAPVSAASGAATTTASSAPAASAPASSTGFPPRLRVAANGAAASSRARAPTGYYILLQSKEQGPYPSARITIR
ncbi:hypothetical protein GUJ93_ZPchr0007g5490 [Zizania palustris]|uniref:Uncharacterized protein n=1 Tax=Zizania palustris TaxID=103762 RepID=A0A8J5SSS9_ZIZPA|nr:hypothetical protein GUJ93_ZPchr0007g5490 [Zizania palustris]